MVHEQIKLTLGDRDWSSGYLEVEGGPFCCWQGAEMKMACQNPLN